MSPHQSLSSIVQILLEPAIKGWKLRADQGVSFTAYSLISAIDWTNLGGQAKILTRTVDSETTFLAFSLMEALQWINLGAQTGAFPRDEANVFITDNLADLKTATGTILGTGLLNHKAAYQVGDLISSVGTLAEFKTTYPKDFLDFPEAATFFITSCSECCAFIGSDQADFFTRRLISNYQDEWTSMVASMTDETFEEEGLATISPLEGYFTTLQHLDRLAGLLSEVDFPSNKWPALSIVRDAIGRLHGWRFCLDNQYFKDRFTHATDIVGKRLAREGKAADIDLDSKAFSEGVEQVVRRYLLSIGALSSQAAG